MLVCNFCGAIKNEEDLKTYTQIHDYTDLQPIKETRIDSSCECGKGEYVPAQKCKLCGVWFYDEDRVGICEGCIDNAETFENAVKFGSENTEKVDINGLFVHLFSEQEINDIIERYAEQHFTDECREIARYCEEDLPCFVDFLERNCDGR